MGSEEERREESSVLVQDAEVMHALRRQVVSDGATAPVVEKVSGFGRFAGKYKHRPLAPGEELIET